MKHLSIRVAWHDNGWNGTVCNNPANNSFCLQLKRIYESKKAHEEEKMAGKSWADLTEDQLPPCKAEGAAFMSAQKWQRVFSHPYKFSKETPHSKLLDTPVEVQPYSTFAVPFNWMLARSQQNLTEQYPSLSADEKALFNTSWVYGEKRQREILDVFFKPIHENRSLVFFYTKSGNPVDENCRRLLIGVGLVSGKSKLQEYQYQPGAKPYPMWDRLIGHSIRPNGIEGFLLPYSEYLVKSGNAKEDEKRTRWLEEIKMTLFDVGDQDTGIGEFSYGSEWVKNSTALAVLLKLRLVVERIQRHGLVAGKWEQRLEWLDQQVGKVKDSMGAFPSFGQATTALGFKFGNILAEEMYEHGWCLPKGNPWRTFEEILNGAHYPHLSWNLRKELPQIKDLWENLEFSSQKWLEVLSRFELSQKQIARWYDKDKRANRGWKMSNQSLLENPYLISEFDEGDNENSSIPPEAIDLGLIEDKAIQGDYMPNAPAKVDSTLDKRRIRAYLVKSLRLAAREGDTLLSFAEARERLENLKTNHSCAIPDGYIQANSEYLSERLNLIETGEARGIQLKFYSETESFLGKIFAARAARPLSPLSENWRDLISQTLVENKIQSDGNNPLHVQAMEDQINALETIVSRKLTVLHGKAGTGKTTVMGALFRSPQLRAKGILLLAPTGKARVRLKTMAKSDSAFTIAQFLTRQKRFNWETMRPLFDGKETYAQEKTVVIDECSMLTMEDFFAVFKVLDLAHVERIILVGDPFQLPPIGAGRPFADLCAHLQICKVSTEEGKSQLGQALAELSAVVRQNTTLDTTESSDTLMLAAWFSGKKPEKNADQIFEKIALGKNLNDLRVECWADPADLEQKIKKLLEIELGVENEEAFNRVALGYEGGKFPMSKPELAENFQILTPVKSPAWGSHSLNRFIQQTFRKTEFSKWEKPFGDQRIWLHDKVIQLNNEKREAYKKGQAEAKIELSNGQIGVVISTPKGYANICFTGYPDATFGYEGKDFSENGVKIELAYAITVHKSQGSDFKTVMLVLPENAVKLISRELLYTALTRSKTRLIILAEGDNAQWLYQFTKPEFSETARRNTQLFTLSLREKSNFLPFSDRLIHKVRDREVFVRSKSELVIANMLVEHGIEFHYERRFESNGGGYRLPDFTFIDAAGEKIIWEHLGLLHQPAYREDWERKLGFYKLNGFNLGENLFTTFDSPAGALNSDEVLKVINRINEIL